MKKACAVLSMCFMILLTACGGFSRCAWADESRPASQPRERVVLGKCLVIPPVGRYGRAAVYTDAVEARLTSGQPFAPKAGDTVNLPDGTSRTWQAIDADQNGRLKHAALKGGYAYIPLNVRAETPKVMLLAATGHGMVYVNGEPRAGDPYRTGYVWLPVLLKPGRNDLLFHCVRGELVAKLVSADAPALLNVADATLPDLIIGQAVRTLGAAVVINATTAPLNDLFIRAAGSKVETTTTPLPPVPPLSVRKVGFALAGPAPSAQGQCKVNLEIMKDGEITDAETVTLRIRRPEQSYKQTFRSRIDGSVQYYAVNPAASVAADARPALFLTLHGATVQASGQVDSYSPKDWGHVVAPTNRRPFGFDWEDWGRIDAIEVLEIVQKRLRTDPQRTYLTGHSMGGHGVWHVGAIYPDRFAAIGPSAGWISFWTYAGGVASYKNPTPIEQILMRSVAASQTLALSANYGQYGVYILHGEKDNEVPVEQSRRMNRHLRKFHKDVVYHEQPDVKHWWDLSKDRPGTDCVDWPAMFDFFARHKNTPAGQVEKVNFVTVNPGISAWSDWVGIIAQIHHLQPSSVSIRYDAAGRRFVGETKNVVCLALDLRHLEPGKPIHVELDGQKGENIPWPGAEKRIWLAREGGNWKTVLKPAAAIKGPHRYGPFKQAFDNRVMFVYGTTGTPAENAWAYAKARYDAETFWYRGNGSIDVIPDTAFDASADRDRSVIIYGNADTNAAWAALLGDSPVQVGRGVIRVGRAKIAESEALACLFIRPRPESDTALVAAVSGMGLAGMKLTNRLPYFVSGVGYPDCIVIAPEMFQRATGGIIMAGFFGLNWSVETGEFAWAKTE